MALAVPAGGCAASAAAPGASAARSRAQGDPDAGPVQGVGTVKSRRPGQAGARASSPLGPGPDRRSGEGSPPARSARDRSRPDGSHGDPLSRARALLRAGRLDQATTLLQGLAQGDLSANEAFEAAGMLGRLLLSRRLYTRARKVAERMEQARPADPAGAILRSRAEELLGHSGRAMRAAQEAVRLGGNDPAVLRRFAETLLAYGKAGRAAQVARKALSLQPDSSWTLVILGDALWARRRYAEAAAVYGKAVSLGRDGRGFQAMALDRLGTLFQKRKKAARARAVLDRCRKEFPRLGCPYTEAGFMRPDPTRPERGETYAIPRGRKRLMEKGGET